VNIKVVLEYDGTNFAGWQQQVLPIHGEVAPKAPEGLGRKYVDLKSLMLGS